MGQTSVTIDLPLYMEVLSRLPGVTKGDVEEARGVLGLAYNGVPSELTFYRGSEKGDGRIYAKKYWHDYNYTSAVNFFEDGSVKEEAGQFSSKLPSSMAKYFFAGIFGQDELTKPLTEAESSVVEGIRLLYECAEGKGSLDACENISIKAFG